MKTQIISPVNDADIAYAAELIRRGALAAFPTETVYGLGANGLDAAACARIYEAKGRPSDNPLILHVADLDMARTAAREVPPAAAHLLTAFAPGPITVILPKAAHIPDIVTGGLADVGVRCPDHDMARALIRAAGVPIAAPSANTSGRPSPTTAAMVYDDLAGRIPCILDGGACRWGVESTIVDCTEDGVLTILRPGAVTREMIAAELPQTQVCVDPALTAADAVPRAPGMKYRHYAPRAPLTVYTGERTALIPALRAELLRRAAAGEQAGLIACSETVAAVRDVLPAAYAYDCGAFGDTAAFANCLYDALRHFDRTNVTSLIAEGTDENGLGLAVMNRLRKASGGSVVHVGMHDCRGDLSN